jgi:hypothetical protein
MKLLPADEVLALLHARRINDMAELTKKAAWTVMVYLAGDNNLTDASVYAMTEMKRVPPGGGVHIITQFDPKDDYLRTHRYEIGKTDRPGTGTTSPLSVDIFDTSENGSFESESKVAKGHERVRKAARAKGREAALAEALRVAPAETQKVLAELSRLGVAQSNWPLKGELDTRFIEDENRNIRPNETDTGSPVTLYNFLSLCVEQFPADHYMVILCGHGSGTAMDFLLRDDSPASSLTMRELKEAFQQLSSEIGGRKIDILGFDTCLMSMAEVAFELHGLVDFMVSSESYSPLSGWPYQQIMGNLKKMVAEAIQDPSLEPGIARQLATNVVEEYVNFYADYSLGGLSVDQAALNVGEAAALRELVDLFADAMRAELEKDDNQPFKDNIILAHWKAQSFNGELFVDLVDFCNCLLERHKTGKVFELGSKLIGFVHDRFVVKSCYSGPVYQYSHGVSIYFPWSRVDFEYQNLDFVDPEGKKGWVGFLDAYTNLTRREPRGATTVFFNKNRKVAARPFRQTQGKGPEGNAVHSMRNPPVVAEPEACIKARDDLRRGLMSVLGI